MKASTESRLGNESLGNIEIWSVLQNFKTGFIDYSNNVIMRQLRTILRTAAVPRVGRLPEEDLDWKKWIGEFAQLRADYIAQLTILKVRYSDLPKQDDLEQLTAYLDTLKDFDPGILQHPDMGNVITELGNLMKKFEVIQ